MHRSESALSNRLLAYAGGSVAILSLGNSLADAQIIYSGEKDLSVNLTDSYLEIDLDGDSLNDFGFYFDSYGGTFTYNSLVFKYNNRFGAMVNLKTGSYKNSWLTILSTLFSSTPGSGSSSLISPVVAKIPEGDPVSNGQTNWGYASYIDFPGLLGASVKYTVEGPLFTISSTDSRGRFAADSGYIGVRFYIGELQHYGWIRVVMDEDMEGMTIADWAWQNEPDEVIAAGERLLEPEELHSEKFTTASLYPNPAHEQVFFELDGTCDICVFDMRGLCLYQAVHSQSFSLDVSAFSKGIYLVVMEGKGSQRNQQLIIL